MRPGEAGDPNGATNIAGVYVVDAKDPSALSIRSFQQLPTGHTTTCVNDCQWLWTGGPASTTTDVGLGWTFGRPIIVTDLRNPASPVAYPMDPVDLFRRDGFTAYSHDVQVDAAGIAWVSGDGGTRGYHTSGATTTRSTSAFAARRRSTRSRTGAAGCPRPSSGTRTAASSTTPGGRSGARRRSGDSRYRSGELLLATEEDFGPAEEACRNRGQFTIASLKGSYGGEAWRSRPGNKFRLEVVGTWNPFKKEGSRPIGGPYDPHANFCSAHYFDVDGSTVTYAWYGEGTRFLDISDPENPTQFAYWRPDDGIVWASYMHEGYVYTADRTRGVDVLKLTGGAKAARAAAGRSRRRRRRRASAGSWRRRRASTGSTRAPRGSACCRR